MHYPARNNEESGRCDPTCTKCRPSRRLNGTVLDGWVADPVRQDHRPGEEVRRVDRAEWGRQECGAGARRLGTSGSAAERGVATEKTPWPALPPLRAPTSSFPPSTSPPSSQPLVIAYCSSKHAKAPVLLGCSQVSSTACRAKGPVPSGDTCELTCQSASRRVPPATARLDPGAHPARAHHATRPDGQNPPRVASTRCG